VSVNLRSWSLGSFSGMGFDDFYPALLIVGVSAILVFMLSKPIGAFQLGENYAQSMGVNVRRFRVYLILLSSILAACVTAYAGPISFVGIAVPFLIKRSLGTAKPLVVIPASFLGGAVFCMFSDLIARMAFAPTELNISTVTSLFGAPVVIYMLVQKKSKD
ncbi:MAG: iron ABC transporter permease, partial [Lachnospiraceae bacterium]|nr:iron ABC transporter permease [Lachnospiraceae bacterium]